MLLWTWNSRYIFEIVISFSSTIYPEWNCWIIWLFVIFEEISYCFPQLAVPVYIPMICAQEFSFCDIFTNTCYLLSLIVILAGVRYYLIVLLICVSLSINGEHLLVCFLAIYLLGKNVYSGPLHISKLDYVRVGFVFILFLLSSYVLTILCKLTSYHMYDLKCFLLFCTLLFILSINLSFCCSNWRSV